MYFGDNSKQENAAICSYCSIEQKKYRCFGNTYVQRRHDLAVEETPVLQQNDHLITTINGFKKSLGILPWRKSF